MTTTDEERLTDVFRVVFNRQAIQLRDDLSAADVPGWDSFNHVNLIIQIEQEFGIRFSHVEVSTLKNVGQLKQLIDGKLGPA